MVRLKPELPEPGTEDLRMNEGLRILARIVARRMIRDSENGLGGCQAPQEAALAKELGPQGATNVC